MEFRHRVRVAATEMKGKMPVRLALTKIRGVGEAMANVIVKTLKLDPGKKIGEFTDAELAALEKTVHSVHTQKVPEWILNRKKDPETGESRHLVSSDLKIQGKRDVDLMKKIKSYKGMRHAWGLKTRGQRTKSTGRKGKTVGVHRKKNLHAMKK